MISVVIVIVVSVVLISIACCKVSGDYSRAEEMQDTEEKLPVLSEKGEPR